MKTMAWGSVIAMWIAIVSGCESPLYSTADPRATSRESALTLREGDVLNITFPGAPALNTSQTVRRDGKLSLPVGGEMPAAGLTPMELEKRILDAYAAQLVTRQVVVVVQTSAYPVFVSGAVLRPGKFVIDRPITALEAVMEAGGFDMKRADRRHVVVIRHDSVGARRFVLNLEEALRGVSYVPFYLRPSDIIEVPERAIF